MSFEVVSPNILETPDSTDPRTAAAIVSFYYNIARLAEMSTFFFYND